MKVRLLIADTLSLSSIDQSQVLRQTLSLSLGPQHLQAGPILDQLQTENTDREGQEKYTLSLTSAEGPTPGPCSCGCTIV